MQPIKYKLGKKQAKNLSKLKDSDQEKFKLSIELQSNFLAFQKAFFEILTGQDFIISNPYNMPSHVIEVSNALRDVYDLKYLYLFLQLPPRSGKSSAITSFIANAMSLNPYSNFMYISYGDSLSTQMNSYIRDIMMTKQYIGHFGIKLRKDAQSKHFLKTEDGGEIAALGAGGAITGRGAGLETKDKVFGGALTIDDAHNINKKWITQEESDRVVEWYEAKVKSRLNSVWTPVIINGHRVGEYDLQGRLLEKLKPEEYKLIKIPAIYTVDGKEYSYDPIRRPLETTIINGVREKGLVELRDEDPEWFETLYQQNPMATGKQLYRPEDFDIKNEDPHILFSFITADTAETDKTYNDATVFSFFGVYKLENVANTYGLHWINCEQLWIEPKDLKNAFMEFYNSCCRYKTKPSFAVIEEKSTGVTLISELKSYQGIEIIAVKRTTDKISRFLSMQPYISKRLVSFTRYASHINMCIEHMTKITPTKSYRFDDIADTLFDGIRVGLMEKMYRERFIRNDNNNYSILKDLMCDINKINRLKTDRYRNSLF